MFAASCTEDVPTLALLADKYRADMNGELELEDE